MAMAMEMAMEMAMSMAMAMAMEMEMAIAMEMAMGMAMAMAMAIAMAMAMAVEMVMAMAMEMGMVDLEFKIKRAQGELLDKCVSDKEVMCQIMRHADLSMLEDFYMDCWQRGLLAPILMNATYNKCEEDIHD